MSPSKSFVWMCPSWPSIGWIRSVWMVFELNTVMLVLFRVDATLVETPGLLTILVDAAPALPTNSPNTTPHHIFLYRLVHISTQKKEVPESPPQPPATSSNRPINRSYA